MGQTEVSDERMSSVCGLSLPSFWPGFDPGRDDEPSARRVHRTSSERALLSVVEKVVDTSYVRCHHLEAEEQTYLAATKDSAPGPFREVADVVLDHSVEALRPVSLPVDPAPVGSSVRSPSLPTATQQFDLRGRRCLHAALREGFRRHDFRNSRILDIHGLGALRADHFSLHGGAHRTNPSIAVGHSGHHVFGSLVVPCLKCGPVSFAHVLGQTWEVSQCLWSGGAELVSVANQLAVARRRAFSENLVWVEDRGDADVEELLEAVLVFEVIATVEYRCAISVAGDKQVSDCWTVRCGVRLKRQRCGSVSARTFAILRFIVVIRL